MPPATRCTRPTFHRPASGLLKWSVPLLASSVGAIESIPSLVTSRSRGYRIGFQEVRGQVLTCNLRTVRSWSHASPLAYQHPDRTMPRDQSRTRSAGDCARSRGSSPVVSDESGSGGLVGVAHLVAALWGVCWSHSWAFPASGTACPTYSRHNSRIPRPLTTQTTVSYKSRPDPAGPPTSFCVWEHGKYDAITYAARFRRRHP